MRLRKERKKAGLNQYELAALSRGVTQGTISKLETGALLKPSHDILKRLAAALNRVGRNVTADDLQPTKQLTLIRGYRSDRKRKRVA